MSEVTDPVLVRRATIARQAGMVRRAGYTLWLVAVVCFFIAFATDFTPAWSRTIVVALIAGSVLLLPAIIMGYGVKGANREDARLAQLEAQRSARSPESNG